MNIPDSFFCRFGWHAWGLWEFYNTRAYLDDFDTVGREETRQQRQCRACGYTQRSR